MKQFKQFSFFLLQHCYSLLKDRDLLVPSVGDKLKVLYSVIVSNMIFMVDNLPTMEVSAKMLSHHKAVFKNIMTLICHWVKEIILLHINHRITVRCTPSPFPTLVLFGKGMRQLPAITQSASQADRGAFINRNPPSLPTIRASKPLEFSSACYIPYFLTSFNITNFIHTYIIPYKKALGKGAI